MTKQPNRDKVRQAALFEFMERLSDGLPDDVKVEDHWTRAEVESIASAISEKYQLRLDDWLPPTEEGKA